MKWKFEVNGEIRLVLEPESELARTLLIEMSKLSAKGRGFKLVYGGLDDFPMFTLEPIEYRPAPVENPTI